MILCSRPRKDDRWQGRIVPIDSTSWIRRVAKNVSVPESSPPEPDRIPFGWAKDLKFLAGCCFPEL